LPILTMPGCRDRFVAVATFKTAKPTLRRTVSMPALTPVTKRRARFTPGAMAYSFNTELASSFDTGVDGVDEDIHARARPSYPAGITFWEREAGAFDRKLLGLDTHRQCGGENSGRASASG
jgi:hypothetical protein